MKPSPLYLACLTLALLSPAQADAPRHPRFGFPVYTNQPAGKQLSGQHAPATTPALSPEEAQKKFSLPKGFEIRLFASEPEVVNPVAMSWDERGRLWVLELYEYPMGAGPGQTGRDRIKILEDTDNDGRADKVTVFADGMSLATGLLVGNGGVFVGQAPHLYWMEDTNGDDVVDKKTIVQTGFGLEDRHELLNGFTWGPDGQMYMTHGVFTQSRAINPERPGEPIVLTAGVARFQPSTRQFEIYAEGTSNPWGVDFDAMGNAFVSACVIDHLFHLAPGGLYVRQAGQPPHPFAYDLLPSIVDHKHHMAAYAGVQVYQGNQFPEDYRGTILMGNIHDNAVHQDRLTPKGSSFVASFGQDFVRANDGWFMPVSTQVGPDGAVWIMDWYDRYPCYQNANADPAGVDRERGRIWRVVHVGDQPNRAVPPRPSREMDLGKLSSAELVQMLANPNSWQRRTAQRLLSGRKDASTTGDLVRLTREGATPEARLSAFWTLFSSGLMTEAHLDAAATSKDIGVRTWAARFTGERRAEGEAPLKRLTLLAGDASPVVRSAVATAIRQYTSGALTIDTPVPEAIADGDVGEPLVRLIETSKDASDPVLPFMIFHASEPLVIKGLDFVLPYLSDTGSKNMPLSGHLASRVFRRVCDERNPAQLDKLVEFFQQLPPDSDAFASVALNGVLEGLRGKAVTPTVPTEPLIRKLLASANKDLAAKAQRLGTLWGDAAALKGLLSKVTDASAPEAERIAAIRSARQSRTDDTRNALHQVVATATASDALKIEAIRAIGELNADTAADRLLPEWDKASPATRRAMAEMMAGRPRWIGAFLAQVQKGVIKRGDIPPNVIRNLATHKDDYVRNEATRAFGRWNSSPAEKLGVIRAKRSVVIDGPVDLEAGHQIATRTCLICHKLHGEGADVGPDLTGVGRSSLDALLHNVITPNEIIGQGYENVEVETRDGRTLSGRMVENTDVRVRLLLPGPAEEVISKADVKSLRVTENSAMPEGLENMPDADFRNLIWYILSPPKDGKPLTPQRRQELINAGSDQAAIAPVTDGESVALWNPEWRVVCPPFEGAPSKLPEFAGRRNVLMTHPINRDQPAILEREVSLPAGSRAELTLWVASHESGDWELRVLDGDLQLHSEIVSRKNGVWREVRVNLAPIAGKKTHLRLENRANNWSWEFGYWADVRIRTGDVVSNQP